MVNIILQSLFCFFAIYGIIQIVISIYTTLQNLSFKNTKDVYIIITVKNQQDVIEGIIRSIAWKGLNDTYNSIVPNILIVDMGSTDDTKEILTRLSKEYSFIHVTDIEKYNELWNQFTK